MVKSAEIKKGHLTSFLEMLYPRHRWQKALSTLPFASSFLCSFSHILNICPESAAQTEGFPAMSQIVGKSSLQDDSKPHLVEPS